MDAKRFSVRRASRRWRSALSNVEHKPLVPITDAQLDALAAALGVDPDSAHVNAVRDALTYCVARGKLTGGDHRAADIKTLQALAQAMDGMNSNVLGRLARHGAAFDCCDPAQIAAAAREAIEALKQERPALRRGPKRYYSRDVLLRELNEIYTEATGRKPARPSTWENITDGERCPHGHFFLFMQAVRAVVPKLAPTDEALTDAAVALLD